MKLFFVFTFLLSCFFSQAQYGLNAIQGNVVETYRYTGIDHSPYMFDHWIIVNVIPSSGPPIEGIPVNFNGYTQRFEMKKNNVVFEMKLEYVVGMTLAEADSTCGHQSFLKFFHPKLTNTYPLFVFNGRKHRLIKDFTVHLSEKKLETTDNADKIRRFEVTTSYYILTGSTVELIMLNRKDILKKFGNEQAEAFVKDNAIDLNTEAGVCQYFTWLEKN